MAGAVGNRNLASRSVFVESSIVGTDGTGPHAEPKALCRSKLGTRGRCAVRFVASPSNWSSNAALTYVMFYGSCLGTSDAYPASGISQPIDSRGRSRVHFVASVLHPSSSGDPV